MKKYMKMEWTIKSKPRSGEEEDKEEEEEKKIIHFLRLKFMFC